MSTVPLTQNSWNSGYPELDGQLLIGQTGENPIAAVLTPGFGIEITNAAGEITIAATGQRKVEKVTVNTAMLQDYNYIVDGATQLEMTLPATAALGSVFTVTNINIIKGFLITQAAGQSIQFG